MSIKEFAKLQEDGSHFYRVTIKTKEHTRHHDLLNYKSALDVYVAAVKNHEWVTVALHSSGGVMTISSTPAVTSGTVPDKHRDDTIEYLQNLKDSIQFRLKCEKRQPKVDMHMEDVFHLLLTIIMDALEVKGIPA